MRLKRQADIMRVFRSGKVTPGTCLSLHVLPSDQGPRLGIVVSRRYGPAVERNRAKRKIREAFRRSAGELPKVDIVVRPQEGCHEATVDAIAQVLWDGIRRSMMNREGLS